MADGNKAIDELQEQLNQLQQQLLQQRREIERLKMLMNAGQPSVQATIPKPAKESSNKSLENFIGLRVIHLLGIFVLLIGLSIGVKLAIDQNLISPVTRIIAAYIAAGILLVLSFYLKKNYVGFSAILFSGAMASLYFTTYGAFVYYNFFSSGFAFFLMCLLAAYTAFEALRYNRQLIAVLGMIGAYSIPLLVHGNNEKYGLLFTYMLVMNAGLLFISFKRTWRFMNCVAIVITWLFMIIWLLYKFQNNSLVTAIIFIPAFYFVFTFSNIVYRVFHKTSLSVNNYSQLLLNDAAAVVATFILVYNFQENLAPVAGLFSLFFAACGIIAYQLLSSEKALNRNFFIESMMMASLFISLQFSGLYITFLWMLLAILIFASGFYMQIIWPRLLSLSLLGCTVFKLIIFDSSSFQPVQKIIAYISVGCLLLILSFFYQKFKHVFFDINKNDN